MERLNEIISDYLQVEVSAFKFLIFSKLKDI